jgi:hypothetical protein
LMRALVVCENPFPNSVPQSLLRFFQPTDLDVA